MKYCCDVCVGTPRCYLENATKSGMKHCRSLLAASHEPLAHPQNIASLNLFYRYYFGKHLSELAGLV